MNAESGSLTLVATPIGNLGDLSERAREALRTAEAWLVEDTRVSGRLGSILGEGRPMRVVNEHTKDPELHRHVEAMAAGGRFALLTDGGTPAISDPGARLVDLCREADIPVTVVPGPSAVTAALALSGFYAQRFAFLGFLGRKEGAIRGELGLFRTSPLTLVVFESPYRIDALLKAAHLELGERRFALCREITKLHEQVWRGRLGQAPSEAQVPRKGEFTVVIEGLRRGEVTE
jgi:16S rRNA (cytidine1402-2'-O)-methyltransferase